MIEVSLPNTHKLLLAVLRTCSISRLDQVAAAAQLAHQTESDYAELLARIVSSGIYPPNGKVNSAPKAKALPSKPPSKEINEAVKALASLELVTIKRIRRDRTVDYTQLHLTEEGRRAADTVMKDRRYIHRPPVEERRKIFIACAFGKDDVNRLCDEHLIPACEDVEYAHYRVDRAEPISTITDAILEEIRKCRLMVADLTYARPSVYFEVGIAHGLGIPLILTCREDHLRSADDLLKVHFDLAQFRISFWKEDERTHKIVWPDEASRPVTRLRGFLNTPESERPFRFAFNRW